LGSRKALKKPLNPIERKGRKGVERYPITRDGFMGFARLKLELLPVIYR
jgi:hypothetical protein